MWITDGANRWAIAPPVWIWPRGIEHAVERCSHIHRPRRLRGSNPGYEGQADGYRTRAIQRRTQSDRLASPVAAAVLRQPAADRAFGPQDRARHDLFPHGARAKPPLERR